jgi:hypothetical protein
LIWCESKRSEDFRNIVENFWREVWKAPQDPDAIEHNWVERNAWEVYSRLVRL